MSVEYNVRETLQVAQLSEQMHETIDFCVTVILIIIIISLFGQLNLFISEPTKCNSILFLLSTRTDVDDDADVDVYGQI